MILKIENQKNHLMDLSSDMGLTTRKLQSEIALNDNPRYFQVLDSEGKKYCQCGSEVDAQIICELNSGFTFTVHLLPPPPKTVNVPHVRLDDDLQLPAQQILPQSELEPFIV
jgi:hypothetical protein